MNKLSLKVKNRIDILKANGKKSGKDFFLTEEGNLIIKKKDYNEIIVGS